MIINIFKKLNVIANETYQIKAFRANATLEGSQAMQHLS